MNIEKVFDNLDKWRYLPSYQLERRADIFFAIHLEHIVKKFTGTEIDLIIPEFPIKKQESNRSFKIDYLAVSKCDNIAYLIELKTDIRSRNTKQDNYLKKANNADFKHNLENLKKIYSATKQKVKYEFLLDEIESLGWIKRNGKEITINEVSAKSKTIYIQPVDNNNELNIISFSKIIEYLHEIDEPLTIRFIESLKIWINDTNKR